MQAFFYIVGRTREVHALLLGDVEDVLVLRALDGHVALGVLEGDRVVELGGAGHPAAGRGRSEGGRGGEESSESEDELHVG